MQTATVRHMLYELVRKRAKLKALIREDNTFVVSLAFRMDGRLWKASGVARVHPLDRDKVSLVKGFSLARRRAERKLVDMLLSSDERVSKTSFMITTD